MAVGYESTQKTIKIDDDNKLIIANTARQSDGLPRGGRAVGPGLNVKFQTGPVEVEGGRKGAFIEDLLAIVVCLLYTSPSPRDRTRSRMPSSA